MILITRRRGATGLSRRRPVGQPSRRCQCSTKASLASTSHRRKGLGLLIKRGTNHTTTRSKSSTTKLKSLLSQVKAVALASRSRSRILTSRARTMIARTGPGSLTSTTSLRHTELERILQLLRPMRQIRLLKIELVWAISRKEK